ncbi:MAG: putative colanic acid biosynthesis acetyltransferase [Desulfobulbaceae bacterium]|nr:putative colanic acid biosynthesis acetyltransferase [Desulfobulbaceae bacterium]
MIDSTSLDILGNRSAQKYTKKEMVLRVLWGVCVPLFRFSPRPFFSWRRAILRLFGATIGKHVHIYNSATIYMPWNLEIGDSSSIGEHVLVYNLGKVCIGKKVTISHRAHICAGTHDYTLPDLPLKKPPIIISDQVWVCADAFVGPGVVVGEGAVVGARSVVMKDIPPWTVVAGNLARIVKKRVIVKYEK